MKTLKDLITVNQNGIVTASNEDIIRILFNELRLIYGYDIDLDGRTADGRFVYDVSLIIQSGLTAIRNLYSNLDPSTATGTYLDMICSLTNVKRFQPSFSYARVSFTNSGDSDAILDSNTSVLLDDAGNMWYLTSEINEYSLDGLLSEGETVTIPKGKTVEFVYQASEVGKITTSSFHFLNLKDSNANLAIAIGAISIGSDEESDSDLRSRRADDSSYGITILNGLRGALTSIMGIKGAKIVSYSGDGDDFFWLDNTKYLMSAHTVSIVLWLDKVNPPKDARIAKTIRDYMTPGISTNQYALGDLQKSYSFFDDDILSTYYWAVAKGVHPDIHISLNPSDSYGGKSTAEAIAKALTTYMNAFRIGYRFNAQQIIKAVQDADPLYMSSITYFVKNVAINGKSSFSSDDDWPNKGSYFDYESYIVQKDNDDWSEFTIKENA